MDQDWQNIIASYKKVKSNKLLFIKNPVQIQIKNQNKVFSTAVNSTLVQNNDKKYVRNFIPEYRLDLHGFNKEQAFAEILKFIKLNFQNNNRKIIVITGKGNKNGGVGILRSHVSKWLNDPQLRYMIADFSEASKKYGGSGAFFISLKKQIQIY